MWSVGGTKERRRRNGCGAYEGTKEGRMWSLKGRRIDGEGTDVERMEGRRR